MDIKVIDKGEKFEIDVVSKQQGPKKYYFGAGWDNPNGPVDLDIVCALLIGGVLKADADFVYFGNRRAPGVELSEDNTTGDGDGDDENIVINTAELPADVNRVVVGLACYAGANMGNAPNPHFRVVDGDKETDPQIGDIPVGANAGTGDTVLVAFALNRKSDGSFELENIGEYHQKGSGKDAISGFAKLFQ